MLVVANPLDYFHTFVDRAVALTYHALNTTPFPPTLQEIEDLLPPHFYQELVTDVVTTEQFSVLGVEDLPELLEKVDEGLFDRFIPNLNTLRMHLNRQQLSYLERIRGGYVLQNCSVVEVW